MASDIYPCITGNAVKNYDLLMLSPNNYQKLGTCVSNKPPITGTVGISGKYDTRFDDKTYYTYPS